MGGKALGKTLPRLTREKYEQIVSDLKSRLQPEYFLFVEEPRSFPDKTSFGDVDLLASGSQKALNPTDNLGASCSSINGNVVSFEYLGHQVDIIKIPEDRIELSKFFFGYGDTGMIMGMFMRNLGLKFGMHDLTLKCETYKIRLSHDLLKIMQFLGLDYARWQQGFTNEQDMFKFIQSCKFFRPSFFARLHENIVLEDAEKRNKESDSFEEPTLWNHEARSRLAERPMFRHWIDHVATLPLNSDRIDTKEIKAQAVDFFNKGDELNAIQEHLSLTRRVKAKFNGKLVLDWINNALQGADLGVLIAHFKQDYPLKRLDTMSAEEIQRDFCKCFQIYPHN